MDSKNGKKRYEQPKTVRHSSMNLVQGSGSYNYKLYYTSLYYKLYYTSLYYKLYYTSLYYYH